MRKIGKYGKRNIKANKRLKEIYQDKGTTRCEARLDDCMGQFGLSFAHRHKRNWYYSRPELLSDYNQTIIACASCHQKLEASRELTKKIFKRLRGDENN